MWTKGRNVAKQMHYKTKKENNVSVHSDKTSTQQTTACTSLDFLVTHHPKQSSTAY